MNATTTILALALVAAAPTAHVYATQHEIGEGVVSADYVKAGFGAYPKVGDSRRYDNVVEKIVFLFPDGRAGVVRKLFYKSEAADYRNVGAFASYHQK
jgi:hypothetical protein